MFKLSVITDEVSQELETACIKTDRVAPVLLPDYTDPQVRRRQLTSHYIGTLR